MSSYSQPCIFCKQEIRMSNDSGNWLPYNLNGSLHECRESRKNNNNKATVTDSMVKPHHHQQTSTLKLTLTLESLDQRIKNIEESFDIRIKKIEAVLFRD